MTLEGDLANRRGLLGQGSWLMATSVADRTSPVQRSKGIMEVLLGSPPPPPNVQSLDETKPVAVGRTLSTRERMEQRQSTARAPALRDHVEHARHEDDERAVAPEEVALETRVHVVGQREARHHPQLLREEAHDSERCYGEADVRKDGDAAESCRQRHPALDRTAVKHRSHFGDDHQADAEAAPRHPEVVGRQLKPRGDEANRHEERHVEREDDQSDAAGASHRFGQSRRPV